MKYNDNDDHILSKPFGRDTIIFLIIIVVIKLCDDKNRSRLPNKEKSFNIQ